MNLLPKITLILLMVVDWSKEENKEKIAKILAEIEAEAQVGFNVISFIKAMMSSNVNTSASNDISRVFGMTLKNALLIDYIPVASKDNNVKKFENNGVYAPDNSISLYRMYSSYLTIVPADQMPINMEKLSGLYIAKIILVISSSLRVIK